MRESVSGSEVQSAREPLVSIVTPAYNGARYLAQCIESVLAQDYQHWEYVIVNNCSTDDTHEIAEGYARQHDRIRVHDNSEFLPLTANWNQAVRQISPESKYCKMVCADDFLFPDCISRMVALAERHPSVGLVSAYSLYGKQVKLDDLPHSSDLVPGRESSVMLGREICRAVLLGEYRTFGCPTAWLLRADPIRSRESFFDEAAPQPDQAACYQVLHDCDFGFIHQVLTFTRVHAESVTNTTAKRMDWDALASLYSLKEYGPVFLRGEEYGEYWDRQLRRYYRQLARSALNRKGRDYWVHHRTGLGEMGEPLRSSKLVAAVARYLVERILSPRDLVGSLVRRWGKAKSTREGNVEMKQRSAKVPQTTA